MIKVGDKVVIGTGEQLQITSISPYIIRAEGKGVEMTISYSKFWDDIYSYEKKRADAADANWEKLKQYVDENITESDREYQSTHDLTYDGAGTAYEDVYNFMQKLERGEA